MSERVVQTVQTGQRARQAGFVVVEIYYAFQLPTDIVRWQEVGGLDGRAGRRGRRADLIARNIKGRRGHLDCGE